MSAMLPDNRCVDVLLDHGFVLGAKFKALLRHGGPTGYETLACYLLREAGKRDTLHTAAGGRVLPVSAGPGSVKACWKCGAQGLPLKKCAGCDVALYCGAGCQKVDWKEGGHKAKCAGNKAARDGGKVRGAN